MRARLLFGFALASLVPSLAQAHAALRVPTPRNPDSGIKDGPCGPYGPGTGVRTQLVAGQPYQVEFDETVNHPGYFQVFFSNLADTNYVLIEDQIPHSNAGPTPTLANPRRYTATITVPSTPCASCSLQLIQVMTEDPANPSLYYSCADIEILAVAPTDAGVSGPDAASPADTGSAVSADAGTTPARDASPAADAMDAGALDAMDPGSTDATTGPDAAVSPVGPDGAASVDDAAPGPASARPQHTRQTVGGGCAAVTPSELGPAALTVLLVALRRRGFTWGSSRRRR